MHPARRIRLWARRCRRARRYGIWYIRSKTFRAPPAVTLQGRTIHLQYVRDELDALSGAFMNVILDDVYGLELVQNISTCLDVGANHGLFLLAVKSVFPDATVHGYEANPSIWPIFEHNYRTLGGVPHRAAIGAHSGYGQIAHPPDGAGSMSAQIVASTGDGPIRIVSLRDAIEQLGGSVDFVKLDCEGAEWSLLSLRDTLRRAKYIALEYHDFGYPECVGDYRSYAQDLLSSANHEIVFHRPDGAYGVILSRRRER